MKNQSAWWIGILAFAVGYALPIANQHLHRWQDRLDKRKPKANVPKRLRQVVRSDPGLAALTDPQYDRVAELVAQQLRRSEIRSVVVGIVIAATFFALGRID